MTAGEHWAGKMGTIEIEEPGPFTVTNVAKLGVRGSRVSSIEQVRLRFVTGPMQGELRQWAVAYVESNFDPRAAA